MIQTYDISQLRPYINWPYFFFAWQVKDPSEKERLRQEAEVFLDTLEGNYHAHVLFLLLDAYSDGDDIIVDGHTLAVEYLFTAIIIIGVALITSGLIGRRIKGLEPVKMITEE